MLNCDMIWAKSDPYETLKAHSLKTAKVMLRLCSVFPEKVEIVAGGLGITEEECRNLCAYFAGVHDIGKAVPCWQNKPFAPEFVRRFYEENPAYYDRNEESYSYRHEQGGALILRRIWEEDNLFDKSLRRPLSETVLVHHQKCRGKKVRCTRKDFCAGLSLQMEEFVDFQGVLEAGFRTRYSIDEIAVQGVCLDCSLSILSGLLMLADYLASSLSHLESESPEFDKRVDSLLDRRILNGDLVTPDSFCGMWPFITEPRPMQTAVESIVSGHKPLLTIIEAPMGEGKTEAAIYAAESLRKAYKKAGVFVGMPTQATANQMHDRVGSLYGKYSEANVRLLHGGSWLQSNEQKRSDLERFFAPSKFGLFQQFGVGTVDQFLLAFLKRKYANFRLTGLCDKVVVLDEMHAYDAYMDAEIESALVWCKKMNIPVVMLSATLPAEKRKRYLSIYAETEDSIPHIEYPAVTYVTQNGECGTEHIARTAQDNTYVVQTKDILNSPRKIAALAVETVSPGGTMCVTMNTVKEAMAVRWELEKILGDDSSIRIDLFHSRYTNARRAEIEAECVSLYGKDRSRRPDKAILVATQVVEQSLDLDFDHYISAICPIDLLLQRIGRQFRHKGFERPTEKPVVTVLLPEKESEYGMSGYVYFRYYLDRTAELLRKAETIAVPTDMQRLVDDVYKDEPPEEEINSFYDMMATKTVNSAEGQLVSLKEPSSGRFQFGEFIRGVTRDADLTENATRMSLPSVSAAVLPEDLYDAILRETASKDDYMLAYRYVFKISQKLWEEAFEGETVSKGNGFFSDVFLLKSVPGSYAPEGTADAKGIAVNRDYGILVGKEANYAGF